ncbi:MAG: hypothetical protein IK115_12475 [Lachnospiraceae bacterium]|nr:hypothetical protein [Lachnospiraceae bacterium]
MENEEIKEEKREEADIGEELQSEEEKEAELRKEQTKAELMAQLAAMKKPMEKMYWTFLVVILLYDVLSNTVVISGVKSFLYGLMPGLEYELQVLIVESLFGLRYLIVIPAIYTILMKVKDNNTRYILAALLFVGWFYALYWRDIGDTVVFEVLLMMVASYGKDFKKIGRYSLVIATGVLIVAFFLSLVGVLPDSIMMRGDLARHSFGTYHCTDLAAHWAFIILTYVFLADGIMKWPAYLIMLILTVLNFLLVDGRTAYLCVILAAGGSLIHTFVKKKGIAVPEKLLKAWQYLLLSVYVLLAALYMLMNFTYDPDPNAFYNRGLLDHLGTRLNVSSNVTRIFPFSWFGKYWIQIGDGMGAAEKTGMYTFLDDSYIRVYAMYGIVAFVLILLLLTAIQWKLMKKGQTFRMFIMAIVALSCFFEHHMLELGCNIFLLVLFAKLPETEEGSVESTDKEEKRLAEDLDTGEAREQEPVAAKA